jgi:hypothetical protein
MHVPHFIAIEPQDEENYIEALEKFDLKEFASLLILPFSNHGDGPGRARNWCWEHSIEHGHKRHWVMDDNLLDFYRVHKNERIRVETGVCFRVMEDFVDRYENVLIAGPQYRGFLPEADARPAYVKNTRIYSCLLIDNSCRHRWRGRYNEDTDLCLNVLKDGDCTVQFNVFLQGKVATQALKGGNTDEFYHKEGSLSEEEWRKMKYNPEGTIKKSAMLVAMHPDVARVVWKYDRWHHYVDYEPFKKNKLKLKKDFKVKQLINNYGMVYKTFKDFDELNAYFKKKDEEYFQNKGKK